MTDKAIASLRGQFRKAMPLLEEKRELESIGVKADLERCPRRSCSLSLLKLDNGRSLPQLWMVLRQVKKKLVNSKSVNIRYVL